MTMARTAMSAIGFWERHLTARALFDVAIMPWSAKAKSLIQEQYADDRGRGAIWPHSYRCGLATGGRLGSITQHRGP